VYLLGLVELQQRVVAEAEDERCYKAAVPGLTTNNGTTPLVKTTEKINKQFIKIFLTKINLRK